MHRFRARPVVVVVVARADVVVLAAPVAVAVKVDKAAAVVAASSKVAAASKAARAKACAYRCLVVSTVRLRSNLTPKTKHPLLIPLPRKTRQKSRSNHPPSNY